MQANQEIPQPITPCMHLADSLPTNREYREAYFLTFITIYKLSGGLTKCARKCPPNPTCNRYLTRRKKTFRLNIAFFMKYY